MLFFFHNYRNKQFSGKPILRFYAVPFLFVFAALIFSLLYLPCVA